MVGGGRVDYVQVWTRTREYLTIGWMVVGSFAIMFDDDMFECICICMFLELGHRSGWICWDLALEVSKKAACGWYIRASVVFVQVVDVETLDRIRTLKGPAVLLVAAFFGSVRLLDNMELNIEG